MRHTVGNHLNMLCDMSEIASLLVGSDTIENFLQRTVFMVAEHLKVPVCSIYLYDDREEELVLKATKGLNPMAVDRIRMKLGEGLVGTALTKHEAVLEGSARSSKAFKYFEEADEEEYESFLALPVRRGRERIGVIVVQHREKDYFSEIDVLALRGIAAQLAGVIANARLLMSLDIHTVQSSLDEIFERIRFTKGKSASEGFAFGLSVSFERYGSELEDGISGTEGGGTTEDFHRALEETGRQLEELQQKLFRRLPEAASLIFDAHHMILKDEGFSRRVLDHIEQGVSAAESVRLTANHYIKLFSSSRHEALREKALDVEDLALRIIANIKPSKDSGKIAIAGRVVIADILYPSDILKLAAEDVKGAILVGGGTTSHIAILSRSLQFPLVIADNHELLEIPRGTPILIDADMGNIFVNPSQEVIGQFEKRNRARLSLDSLARNVTEGTYTRDGERIRLMANINILGELEIATNLKAEGVGLYRTEFPFLVRSSYPSEEEQYQVYRRLFQEMEGKQVVVRTLDLAGDKVLPYAESRHEDNPQLGLRSIRFLMANQDVFEQQVRAILRAAEGFGSLGILFPLISSVDEFRQAREFLEYCGADLQRQGIPCHASPQVGLMIELPSLVDIVDALAEEADFASIGTNDFVQYMLAADRGNDQVLRYYQPFHPSVLRSLKRIVKAFQDRGKEISLCGELARDADYLPFLAGIGVRTLSLDPRHIPAVQRRLSGMDSSEAWNFAEGLLAETTIAGVMDRVSDYRKLHYDPLYSHGSCQAGDSLIPEE